MTYDSHDIAWYLREAERFRCSQAMSDDDSEVVVTKASGCEKESGIASGEGEEREGEEERQEEEGRSRWFSIVLDRSRLFSMVFDRFRLDFGMIGRSQEEQLNKLIL